MPESEPPEGRQLSARVLPPFRGSPYLPAPKRTPADSRAVLWLQVCRWILCHGCGRFGKGFPCGLSGALGLLEWLALNQRGKGMLPALQASALR